MSSVGGFSIPSRCYLPSDTMEAILASITALLALITKALPDDELQRKRFELRHPKLYQRIYTRILNRAAKELKRMGVSAEDTEVIHAYVQGIKMDENFETLIKQKLQ